jgi:hypothetical protein
MPAIAILGGRIYVLWTRESAPHDLWMSSSAALGQPWTSPALAVSRSGGSIAPAVCSDGTDLYAVWRGGTAALQISVFDGSAWSAPKPVPGAASQRDPAVACTTASASVVWTNVQNEVAVVQLVHGVWGGVTIIPGSSSTVGPGATSFDGVTNSGTTLSTVISWTQATTGAVYYTSEAGLAGPWGASIRIAEAATSGSPAVFSDADWGADPGYVTLYAAWKAESGSKVSYAASNAP